MAIQMDNNRVLIFDTTLRDGEQSPGCSMTTQEKLSMAHALEDLGVDILSARGYDMLGDTIDFGRYVIPIVREEVAKRDAAKTERRFPAADALAIDG